MASRMNRAQTLAEIARLQATLERTKAALHQEQAKLKKAQHQEELRTKYVLGTLAWNAGLANVDRSILEKGFRQLAEGLGILPHGT